MTAAEQPGRFELATVAFFGRTFAEYLEMFALGESDLAHRSILDVAAGPSSASASTRRRLSMGTVRRPAAVVRRRSEDDASENEKKKSAGGA